MTWFTEKETDHLRVQHQVREVLYQGRSKYQDITVIKTRDLGKALILDGIIQVTLGDEFIYHEMLTHVPLFTHAKPEQVLVIGGGDGGTVREVLKHPEVKRVHLVEIDRMVIEVARTYLPEVAGCLDDPRVEVHVADGIEFVKQRQQAFDAVIIDAPDPLGAAEGLVSKAFYRDVAKALRSEGVLSLQSGSPFFNPTLVQQTLQNISAHFPTVRLYTASIPSYSIAPWSFALATKRYMETVGYRRPPAKMITRYYSPDIHKAAFALPPYIRKLVHSADKEATPSIA